MLQLLALAVPLDPQRRGTELLQPAWHEYKRTTEYATTMGETQDDIRSGKLWGRWNARVASPPPPPGAAPPWWATGVGADFDYDWNEAEQQFENGMGEETRRIVYGMIRRLVMDSASLFYKKTGFERAADCADAACAARGIDPPHPLHWAMKKSGRWSGFELREPEKPTSSASASGSESDQPADKQNIPASWSVKEAEANSKTGLRPGFVNGGTGPTDEEVGFGVPYVTGDDRPFVSSTLGLKARAAHLPDADGRRARPAGSGRGAEPLPRGRRPEPSIAIASSRRATPASTTT
jgi:hypothetical protein